MTLPFSLVFPVFCLTLPRAVGPLLAASAKSDLFQNLKTETAVANNRLHWFSRSHLWIFFLPLIRNWISFICQRRHFAVQKLQNCSEIEENLTTLHNVFAALLPLTIFLFSIFEIHAYCFIRFYKQWYWYFLIQYFITFTYVFKAVIDILIFNRFDHHCKIIRTF